MKINRRTALRERAARVTWPTLIWHHTALDV